MKKRKSKLPADRQRYSVKISQVAYMQVRDIIAARRGRADNTGTAVLDDAVRLLWLQECRE